MAVPAQYLQNVQTYQESGLAFLQNLNCFIATANTKFRDFDRFTANLGDTVTFDLPPRFLATNSLVVAWQSANQRVLNLTVTQQKSIGFEFTAQQFIFNVRDYMEKYGKGAIVELGANIEADVATVCATSPYRFFGDGVTPINSFGQLAQALAFFRNFGSVHYDAKGYLQDIAVSQIVNSGLNQFTLDRNNEMANSWEVGRFSNCNWYQSNLLPVHTSGTVGQNFANGWQLTITALGAPLSDGSINSFTAVISSADANDPNAILQYDRLQFVDGVAGLPNVRFLTFTGHQVSSCPVQIIATAGAASDGVGNGHVTITFNPPLQWNAVSNQNVNTSIQVGMKLTVAPSHRAGMINAGNPLFIGMPQLPDEVPFPTANQYDPETGVSLRQYYGSQFGQNARGMVYDCIYGYQLVPEYSMAVLFPL